MKRSLVSYIVFLTLSFIFFAFVIGKSKKPQYVSRNVITVKENTSDTLHALLFYHASDYFIYHGYPIGFQYDMLNLMASDIGKKIVITVEDDPEKAFYSCFTNQYDLVAMDIAVDAENSPQLIEINVGGFSGKLFQLTSGTVFGDYTDDVMEYATKKMKNTRLKLSFYRK